MHIAALQPAGAPAQPDFAVAQQVRPPLADAVLLLAERAGALVPVARAQAQLVQDERDERAVVARGPGLRRGGGGGGGVLFLPCRREKRGFGVWRVRGCGGGGGVERVEVGALEAEGEGRGAGALALGGGWSGQRGGILVARGTDVVADGATALEIVAAGGSAWL